MNQGVILKVGPRHAVVMNEMMEVVRLKKKKDMLLGERIYYTQEDLKKPFMGLRMPLIRTASVAFAALVLLLILVNQLMETPPIDLYPNTFAVVTMDINPSLELQINNQGRVMKVHAFNEDGDILVSEDLNNLHLNDALEKLLERAKIHGYLNVEGTVLLTSTMVGEGNGDSINISDVVTVFIEEHLKDYTFMYYEGNQEDLTHANSRKISVGRYKLNAMMDDAVIDDAALEQMSISELEKSEKVRAAIQASDSMVIRYRSIATGNEDFSGNQEQEENKKGQDGQSVQGQTYENVFEHQEKDGGGGQNSDNGQQHLGEDYDNDETDHEPEGAMEKNGPQGPMVTTGAALQFQLEEQLEYGEVNREESGKGYDAGNGTDDNNAPNDRAGSKDNQ